MKHIVFTMTTLLLAASAVAQPPARVRQQTQQRAATQQQKEVAVSERAQLEYPTAIGMPEDVSWRRDLYRTLDLNEDKNAVLYYPQEPQADKMNLFTYLFKLVMRRQVKAYDYTIDGNEDFREGNVIKPKDILDRHHIRYQQRGEQFRIEDSDIPSADVRAYYVKESTYFDQHTSSFRTQVTAICPVRKESDEFGGADQSYPMFWIKYSDVAPYLAKLTLMASNFNNAAEISADDYFTMGQYDGKIYKTSNLQGKVLANYCPTDSAMKQEQTRIENELTTLEDHVWGNDSIKLQKQAEADSIKAAAQASKPAKTARRTTQKKDDTAQSTSSRSQVKRQKSSGGGSGSSSSTPRISVRRQRH